MATFVICSTAQKLKHLALMEIYYQLINTSLVLTYTGFNHCKCYQFSGCRMKPLHRRFLFSTEEWRKKLLFYLPVKN